MRSTRSLGGSILLLAWVAAQTASAQETLLSGLARYELRRGKHVERLDVLRLPDYIEHRYLERGLVEIWERDARGELSHWKVFDRVGRSVHYTPGDLRTVHLEPKWDELSTLRDPDDHGSTRDRTKVRLLNVQPCSAETCTKLNKASFRELEFADLGDSENDPFVRTFLARFSSGHTH